MAEALRSQDDELPITLVSACAADVYDKPLLSVAVAKKLALDQMVRETGAQAAQRLGVRLLANTQATRICTRTKTLYTTRGNHPFEELVLAHGAQVALPPSLPAELCWRINHLDAYRHRITLLDSAPEPLARWADQKAGGQVLKDWGELPITFMGGVAIASVEAAEPGFVVRTTCGEVIEADQVIAATGLATPSRLAQSAGLAWNNGIAVDATTLATSHPNIHALGDCITIDGQASRYIEPIGRQAQTIAAKLAARRLGGQSAANAPDSCPVPYEVRVAVVRVKTTSHPLTLH
jgi:rubredoxin-NAD+ reductase